MSGRLRISLTSNSKEIVFDLLGGYARAYTYITCIYIYLVYCKQVYLYMYLFNVCIRGDYRFGRKIEKHSSN